MQWVSRPAAVFAGIVINFESIIDLIGTGGFLAIILFVAGAFAIGYVAGGGDSGIRSLILGIQSSTDHA